MGKRVDRVVQATYNFASFDKIEITILDFKECSYGLNIGLYILLEREGNKIRIKKRYF